MISTVRTESAENRTETDRTTPPMPTYRPDLASIPVYTPGKPIDEVARELGLEEVVKLASNECPVPPFPEVQEAIAAATGSLHRYPENSSYHLVGELARRHDLPEQCFWVGAGSSQLLGCTALAVGGRGTSAVYADPSFVMYGIYAVLSGAESIKVPLDGGAAHDLDAMAAAIRPETTVVYVCNPNNPTGTHVSADALWRFIDTVPDRVLVVVDEAYAEYATAPDYASAIPVAVERDNVIVARTFSKAYGLAGLRVGYAVGRPETLAQLRRTQPPFSVTTLGQVAAAEALRHPDRLAERVHENARGRAWLAVELAARNVEVAPSQTNFVMLLGDRDTEGVARACLEKGVIIRTLGQSARISVGTPDENARFIEVWDEVASAHPAR